MNEYKKQNPLPALSSTFPEKTREETTQISETKCDSKELINYFLIQDGDGLYLTPDGQQITNIKFFITYKQPEAFLQNDEGNMIVVYLDQKVHILEVFPDNTFPIIDEKNCNHHNFILKNAVLVKFIKKDLLLKVENEFYIFSDSLKQLVNKGRYLNNIPKNHFHKAFYTINEKTVGLYNFWSTFQTYNRFSNKIDNFKNSSKSKDEIEAVLTKSLENNDEHIKDQLICQKINKTFKKNNSTFIHFFNENELIDVSFNKRTIGQFNMNTSNYSVIGQFEEMFDSFDLIESPYNINILILFHYCYNHKAKTEKGVQKAYLINTSQKSLFKVSSINGPIYAAKFNNSGSLFAILSGIIPSNLIIYTKDGQPIIQLGKLYSNSLFFSPNDKYLAVGGFGNLDNDLIIYENDSESWKIKSVIPIKGASNFTFLKDSERFVLSVAFSHQIDKNCFRIYDTLGALLFKLDFNPPSQLISFAESMRSELKRLNQTKTDRIPSKSVIRVKKKKL